MQQYPDKLGNYCYQLQFFKSVTTKFKITGCPTTFCSLNYSLTSSNIVVEKSLSLIKVLIKNIHTILLKTDVTLTVPDTQSAVLLCRRLQYPTRVE